MPKLDYFENTERRLVIAGFLCVSLRCQPSIYGISIKTKSRRQIRDSCVFNTTEERVKRLRTNHNQVNDRIVDKNLRNKTMHVNVRETVLQNKFSNTETLQENH